MTLNPRCCAAAAPNASSVAVAAAARIGLSLALDLAKLTLLLLCLLRFRCASAPLHLLCLFILIGCPQQIILERIEHIVEIEKLGGIEEILHVLRMCCTTFAVCAGALCQLIGGCILASCRNYISTITDLKNGRDKETKKQIDGLLACLACRLDRLLSLNLSLDLPDDP